MSRSKLFLILVCSVLLVSCASCPLPDNILNNLTAEEKEKAEFINLGKKLRCILEKENTFFSKKNTIIVNSIVRDDTGQKLTVVEKFRAFLAEGLGDNFTVNSTSEEVLKIADYTIDGRVYPKDKNLLAFSVKDKVTGEDVHRGTFNLTENSASVIFQSNRDSLVSSAGSQPDTQQKEATEGKSYPPSYIEETLPLNVQEEKGEKYLDEQKPKEAIDVLMKIPGVQESKPDPKLERIYERLHQANFLMYLSEKAKPYLEKAKDWLFKQVVAHLSYTKREIDTIIKFEIDSSEFWGKRKIEYMNLVEAIDTFFDDPDHPSCVAIYGHASLTGSIGYNCQLSEQRAKAVGNIMKKTFSKKKFVAVGRSCLETKTGKAVDDDTTAIDRRVEFKVIGCDEKDKLPNCEKYVETQGQSLETECPQLPTQRSH